MGIYDLTITKAREEQVRRKALKNTVGPISTYKGFLNEQLKKDTAKQKEQYFHWTIKGRLIVRLKVLIILSGRKIKGTD